MSASPSFRAQARGVAHASSSGRLVAAPRWSRNLTNRRLRWASASLAAPLPRRGTGSSGVERPAAARGVAWISTSRALMSAVLIMWSSRSGFTAQRRISSISRTPRMERSRCRAADGLLHSIPRSANSRCDQPGSAIIAARNGEASSHRCQNVGCDNSRRDELRSETIGRTGRHACGPQVRGRQLSDTRSSGLIPGAGRQWRTRILA